MFFVGGLPGGVVLEHFVGHEDTEVAAEQGTRVALSLGLTDSE